MKFYLTGFTGQIGSSIRKILQEKGETVVLLGRSKPQLSRYESYLYFDLHSFSFENKLCITDECTIIHCAYDFKFNKRSLDSINFIGTKKLIHAFSRHASYRFIYFSTPLGLESFQNASLYQKDKKNIEKLFNSSQDLILSPSFLYTETSRLSKIFNFLQYLGLPIPIPKNINDIAPMNVDDFASEIYFKLILPNFHGKFLITGSVKKSFKSFLNINYQIKTIQFPQPIFRLFAKLLKYSPFFYFSERLLGLLNLPNLKELKKTENFKEVDQSQTE